MLGPMLRQSRIPAQRQAELLAEFKRNQPIELRKLIRAYLRDLGREPMIGDRLRALDVPVWIVHADKGDGRLTTQERRSLEDCPTVSCRNNPWTELFPAQRAPCPARRLSLSKLSPQSQRPQPQPRRPHRPRGSPPDDPITPSAGLAPGGRGSGPGLPGAWTFTLRREPSGLGGQGRGRNGRSPGGHGVRQQSSQRRVGGGNTVNRVDYRLPDGNARSFVYRAGHARAAAETGRRAHLVQQRIAFGRQFRGPAGVHP